MIAELKPAWETPETGVETKHFFLCPECKKHQHFYGHLLGQKIDRMYGTWFCHADCGLGVELHLTVDDVLTVRPRPDMPRWVKSLALLRRDDIFLVVAHSSFSDNNSEEQTRYHFDQHNCPTNYCRATQAILIPPCDNDPHGLFQYVASAPDTIKDIANTPAQVLLKHFGLPAPELDE